MQPEGRVSSLQEEDNLHQNFRHLYNVLGALSGNASQPSHPNAHDQTKIILMASPSDLTAREDGRLQDIFSQPDLERNSAQPVSSSPRSPSALLPTICFTIFSGGFQYALDQWKRIVHRQAHSNGAVHGVISAPFPLILPRPAAIDLPIAERAGQVCFLCLEKGQGQFTVAVPCFRPTMPRLPRGLSKSRGRLQILYHDIGPTETTVESDAVIFERLRSACFANHGSWKEWIPFYGIIHVEEVQVSYEAPVQNHISLLIPFSSNSGGASTQMAHILLR